MKVRELVNVIGFRVDEGQFRAAERRVQSFNRGLERFGQRATLLLTAPFVGLNLWMAKTLSDFEQMDVAFETMLGSAEKAKILTQEMYQFAAITPFEIKEIGGVTKQLLAMGSTSEKVIDDLTILGNATAGTGVPMWRLALNFGQVRAQGKLTGREMRDFAVAGINMRKEISKIMGVNEKDVQDMVSAGKVSFEVVNKVFQNMSAKGGIYHDLMTKQSKTIGGMWSNFKDLMVLSVQEYQKKLVPMYKGIINFGTKLMKKFKGLTSTMKVTIFSLMTLAAVIGPLILAFTALVHIGMFVRTALLSVATAARIANMSTSMFLLKFALMGIVLIAALALAVGFFEDISEYMKGNDSAIGRLIEKLNKLNERLKSMDIFTLNSVKETLKSIEKTFDNFIEVIVGVFMGKWKFALNSLKELVKNNMKSIAKLILTVLQPAFDIYNTKNKTPGAKKINLMSDVPNAVKDFNAPGKAMSALGHGKNMYSTAVNSVQNTFETAVNLTLPNKPTQEQIEAVGSNVQIQIEKAMQRAARSIVNASPEIE